MYKMWLGALAVAVLASGPAWAKDARCFTTDDGEYDCAFKALDSDGSFEISAPGKPTSSLWLDGSGTASASADYAGDGHSTSLPGTYTRATDDPGCWQNSDTETEICAW